MFRVVGIELRLALRDDAEAAGDADQLSLGRHAGLLVLEEILERDHVAFHALNLGDAGTFAAAVGHAADLDDEVDGAGDLLADGQLRQIHTRHHDEGLEARDGVPGVNWRGWW